MKDLLNLINDLAMVLANNYKLIVVILLGYFLVKVLKTRKNKKKKNSFEDDYKAGWYGGNAYNEGPMWDMLDEAVREYEAEHLGK